MRNQPSYQLIAQEAGVTTATVSRVVNYKGNVSPATREAVLRAMDKLGRGVPPRALLGLIVPDFRNPFFAGLHDVFERQLEPFDTHLLTASSDGDAQRELIHIKRFQSFGINGLIYVGAGKSSDTLLRLVAEGPFRVVAFDRRVSAVNVDSVVSSGIVGMQRAVDYLALSGHTRIGHVKGLSVTETARERFDGFRAALESSGLDLNDRWVFDGNYQFRAGEEVATSLLGMHASERPTALIAANDLMALGLIRGLTAGGWKLPEQLSIIGYDDIPQCAQVYPALTTVAQPVAAMAQTAVDLLTSSDPAARTRSVTEFDPKLVIRESVAPV